MTDGSTPLRPTTIRRELLVSMGALFVAGFLVALVAIALAAPFLASVADVTAFVGLIVAAELAILFLFGRHLLGRLLLDPVDQVVHGTERIVEGEYDHRIPLQGSEEMDRLVRGVNRMAERLIRDRRLLAENVRSLDETNRELVETTDELIRTARLASVGTMASGLAHEVGNPLGALLGYLDVAERRVHEPGAAGEMLGHARQEARRIDRIVRSLLAFARPAQGGPNPAAQIDLEELVPRVLDLLEAQGVTSDFSVEWDPPSGLPSVYGEPHHLEQVLVNLLVNARDALEDGAGGSVRITAEVMAGPGTMIPRRREDDPEEVDFSHRRRGEMLGSRNRITRARKIVALRVEDDGPGISQEVLPRVFDAFVTGKEEGRGMGLGLAISARMVEEMGGMIEAENRPGGGARFTISLVARGEDERHPGGEG